MRNILLTVSYDGTNFCGWQRQPKTKDGKQIRTVQEEIENALKKLHKTPVSLQGSGRTDSGVHAIAQAANFFSPIDSIPVKNYIHALNNLLPHDIKIMGAEEKPSDFSSRFSAVTRTYRYFISCNRPPVASLSPYVWEIYNTPNIDTLNQMASYLKGELDCATFAAAGDASLSTKRYLEKAHFFFQESFPVGNVLVFEIEANAFLWKMVRSIIGSLIEFERNGKDASYFKSVLDSCNRKNVGATAPSHGLFLWNVNFSGTRHHV